MTENISVKNDFTDFFIPNLTEISKKLTETFLTAVSVYDLKGFVKKIARNKGKLFNSSIIQAKERSPSNIQKTDHESDV